MKNFGKILVALIMLIALVIQIIHLEYNNPVTILLWAALVIASYVKTDND